ncbi:MAG TPA: hypothetical protein VL727_14880 [Puia sp.]|nr:hypothetical protein [Puia sp.]
MKQLSITLLFFFALSSGRSPSRAMDRPVPASDQPVRKYLYKTALDTSGESYGYHIAVREILPRTKGLIQLSIDDRDIIARSNYDRDIKITILGEYLTFRGDTCTSNKLYILRSGTSMTHPERIEGFSVQIEALYSFTRMLTVGFPAIRPTLLYRATGKPVNTDARAVSEVFDIYSRWYKENLKTDFRSLTLPLAGSPYCWIGEGRVMERYLKKSL